MENGVLVLNSRVALACYVIRRLNLDLKEGQISPLKQQIFLTNTPNLKRSNGMQSGGGSPRSDCFGEIAK